MTEVNNHAFSRRLKRFTRQRDPQVKVHAVSSDDCCSLTFRGLNRFIAMTLMQFNAVKTRRRLRYTCTCSLDLIACAGSLHLLAIHTCMPRESLNERKI